MKKKYSPFLILSTAICSGTILINRFVVPIPDKFAVPLLVIAVLSFVIYIVKTLREGKTSPTDKS